MRKIVRCSALILFAVLSIGVASIAEEITLTTYYPAPYGNYEELQATKLAVGSATTMPSTDGDLEASGTIQANTGFNFNGTDGDTSTYTVVTDLQASGVFLFQVLQIKKRTITVNGGIITDVGAETDWITVWSL